MNHRIHIVAAPALVLLFAFVCLAQDQPAELTPAAPAEPVAAAPEEEAQPQNIEALPVIIKAVQGQVQVRDGEDQPWRAAEVGMQVSQGAEFRTGLRSAVQLQIPPDQIITLDRLGTLTVLQAVREAGTNKVKTDLGMKYGRTRYQIEAADQSHDSTIHTASATLAVRGSDLMITDNVLGFQAAVESEKGVMARVKGLQLQQSMGKRGSVTITGDRPQPAVNARGMASINPQGQFAVESFSDEMLREIDAGTGGNAYRGVTALLRQFAEFEGSIVGVPLLDGPLVITAAWFSTDFTTPSDVDLSVNVPGAGTITAANSPVGSVPQQYFHSGNDNGAFASGAEVVTAAISFYFQTHSVNVINNGPHEATIFITATQGPLSDLILNTNVTLGSGQSQSFDVVPNPPDNNNNGH